jgi:hypothetical protein
MENVDFASTDIGLLIKPEHKDEILIEEKKDGEQQMNMMEFSSSIEDLMPPQQNESMEPGMDQYTNPTSGRVTGLSMPTAEKKPKKSPNPFNLTDDQYNAVIAGIVGMIVYSTSIQTKLSGMVPNFTGMNGSIASAILIAVLYYAVHKYVLKK